LILFEWGLKDLGKIGWLTAFIYVATTALRLARFNTQENSSKRYFHGLPCPAAAVLLAASVWVADSYQLSGGLYTTSGLAAMFLLSLAMVSSLPYRSFKDLDLKHRVPFMTVLVLVLVFVLISFDPPRVLFLAFSSYAASGIVTWVLKHRKGEKVFAPSDDKSESYDSVSGSARDKMSN
jgi:CDP-diacylglycerol--serine O-phosphatidyltransferase